MPSLKAETSASEAMLEMYSGNDIRAVRIGNDSSRKWYYAND
jgi:hypothetical protein